MQGVVWAIPQEMFKHQAVRLTGSLAVSFFPTSSGDGSTWKPKPLPMLAHAVVYAEGQHSWVPGQSKFVEFALAPKRPAA